MSWGIPNATGPYPVACHDILNKVGLESSLFRIYYPTKSFDPNEENCPLWMDSDYLGGLAGFLGNGLGLKIFKWYFKGRRIPVLLNGPLVMSEGLSKLPLVLVSHGLGLTKNHYSYMSYEMASRGYFVAAIDHRDGSACASLYMERGEDGLVKKYLPFSSGKLGTAESEQMAGTKVDQRVTEMSKLLDCVEQLYQGTLENILLPEFDLSQFKERINLDKCAIMGHSFGGATTVASLGSDKRFKVGLAFDPWMVILDDKYFKVKTEKPLLFINAVGELKKLDIIKIRLFDCDVTGISTERKMVTILGTTHLTQTDFAYFPKNKILAKLVSRGSTDPQYANDLNLKLVLSFIGKHLDLQHAGEVDDIVKDNSLVLIQGSNIEVDEEEIQKAKIALTSDSGVD